MSSSGEALEAEGHLASPEDTEVACGVRAYGKAEKEKTKMYWEEADNHTGHDI